MPIIDHDYCLAIQCGAISQEVAGPQAIMQCASPPLNMAGVRSCLDPSCVGPARPGYCGGSLPQAPIPPSIQQQVDFMNSTPVASPFIDVNSYEYEGMVECPSDVISDYFNGLDTWREGLEAVGDKFGLLTDLSLLEIAGLLTPLAAGAGVLIVLGKGAR